MDADRLKSISPFSQLPRKERKVIARHADEVKLDEGAKITVEGRLAHELFVIEEGTAEVFDGENLIATMGPGDVVGEIGVLKTHKRTATVVATSPIKAVVIYGPELTALRESMPHLFGELERLVSERTGDG